MTSMSLVLPRDQPVDQGLHLLGRQVVVVDPLGFLAQVLQQGFDHGHVLVEQVRVLLGDRLDLIGDAHQVGLR